MNKNLKNHRQMASSERKRIALTKLTIVCKVMGHKFKYNFPSLPNKAICEGCKLKMKLDLNTLEWENVEEFEGEKRSDEELCNEWVN